MKTYTITKAPIPLSDSMEDIVNGAFKLEDQDREHVFVFATDFSGRIVGYKRIVTGLRSTVKVCVREIIQAAIILGAERFWLAHNHPNGGVVLSVDDLNLTMEVFRAAKVCGMALKGHVIYTPVVPTVYHMHEVEDMFNQLIAKEIKQAEGGDSWSYNNKFLKGTIYKMEDDKYSVTLRFSARSLPAAYRQIRELKRVYVGPEKG